MNTARVVHGRILPATARIRTGARHAGARAGRPGRRHGPRPLTPPIHVVPEAARTTLFEYAGEDDGAVIAVGPGGLPECVAGRTA
ncbi:hypothetical protein SUDANB6_05250 [Streptomyces sp. enrichment culture]|uniref:hypothetical protein n=1 Tax=Streptomyces sp. enrichment culture TaxID=1795815 RepID=UPI003F54C190